MGREEKRRSIMAQRFGRRRFLGGAAAGEMLVTGETPARLTVVLIEAGQATVDRLLLPLLA
jgi:secreted PhoX family phosphatase